MMYDADAPLVFVVGAGASKDFGDAMPVGSELAYLISEVLTDEVDYVERIKPTILPPPRVRLVAPSPPSIFTQVIKSLGDQSQLVDTARQILHGLHLKESIDDLLHEWRDDPTMIQMGKALIAQNMLEAESRSSLTAGPGLFHSVASLSKSWLGQITRYWRAEEIPRRQLNTALESVGFIVFNYDRCIEQFLWAELRMQRLSADDAVKALQKIEIVHPHGDLGNLFGKDEVPFGDLRLATVVTAASRIRTYTEECHDKESLGKIERLLAGAQRVVFLGFNYHPRNVKLLIDHGLAKVPDIWSACVSPNVERLRQFQRQIQATGVSRPKGGRLLDHNCAALLQGNRDDLFNIKFD